MTTKALPTLALLLAGLTASDACHPSSPASAHALARDSAGVAIIESSAPLGAEHLPWSVDTVPIIDLGAHQDDPHEQFGGTVIPVRLATGQIVVAVGSASELRFFDSGGVWLKSSGRSGQGPGEFQSLGWLSLGPGDTMRTYDWGLRRLSIFSPTGAFVRSALLKNPSPERGAIPFGVLVDGRIVVGGTRFVTPGFPSGVTRDTAPLLVYGEAGTAVDSFGSFPGSEALVQSDANSATVMGLPYGKSLSVSVAGAFDAIYVGSADRPEVAIWSPAGRLTRILRWAAPPTLVTEKDRSGFLDALRAEAQPGHEDMQRRLEEMVEKAQWPRARPAYSSLLPGPGGSLWVKGYQARHETTAGVYQIFDSAGQWMGALTLPARFSARQIGDAFILGTWRDPDDVEHVRLYRLAAQGRH